MFAPVGIVDLFSGPGGLGEGFSACRSTIESRPFRIEVSIEKDPWAHATLRLRAFLRHFECYPSEYYTWLSEGGPQPDWKRLYPTEWGAAEDEARCLELGQASTRDFLKTRIEDIRRRHGSRTLLIGGPPCQAYSLAGRSRNAGVEGYRAEDDHRNFLYDEYVAVLRQLMPAVFVMENVKGMLSASVTGREIFRLVTNDLRSAGYRLFALTPRQHGLFAETPAPTDFVVRAEEHGVPQARHRVIIIGIRSDVADGLGVDRVPRLRPSSGPVTVRSAIGGLPRLRSGLSKGDAADTWAEAALHAIDLVEEACHAFTGGRRERLERGLRRVRKELPYIAAKGRHATLPDSPSNELPPDLAEWFRDPGLNVIAQHETRGHMRSDLARYIFVSAWGQAFDCSPQASDFPAILAPAHRSWDSGKFADRFRVQLWEAPATTITSHISKDGHYFIHPDPSQIRSLTVREAARLQTFPDNYLFLGPRTEQYVQVGNAVPPFLARQIAEAILPVFDGI